MRITKYNLELGDNNLPVLVKEKSSNYMDEKYLDRPEKIVNMLNTLYALEKMAEEHLYMVAMNTKCKVLGTFEVSHGTINESYCVPRDIVIRAILCDATNIIIAHNHPSGDTEVSYTDLNTTKQLREVCQLTGIQLTDSIIIGKNSFCSLKMCNPEIFSN